VGGGSSTGLLHQLHAGETVQSRELTIRQGLSREKYEVGEVLRQGVPIGALIAPLGQIANSEKGAAIEGGHGRSKQHEEEGKGIHQGG